MSLAIIVTNDGHLIVMDGEKEIYKAYADHIFLHNKSDRDLRSGQLTVDMMSDALKKSDNEARLRIFPEVSIEQVLTNDKQVG